MAGAVSNLSTGGAAVTVKEPVGLKGETAVVKCRVAIDEVEQYLSLKGAIRSIHGEVDEGARAQVQHGVQFVDVPHGEHVSLTAYVYQKLFEEVADI